MLVKDLEIRQFATSIFSERRAGKRLATGPKLQWVFRERYAGQRPRNASVCDVSPSEKRAGNRLATGPKMRQFATLISSEKPTDNRPKNTSIATLISIGKRADNRLATGLKMR